MTELSKRFSDAVEFIGIKNADIVKKYSVSRQNVNNFMTSQKTMTEKFAEICDGENININWLLTGNGEMFNNTSGKEVSTEAITINYYLDVYAAAGGGAINGHSNAVPMSFDKGFLESLGLKQFKNLDMIKVTGDSMEPFIQNGEMVILERKNEAQNNDVVVANINGQVYIKRYEADPFFKWIKLKSENEFSGDITLENQEEMDALSIIGIVRAKIRPF